VHAWLQDRERKKDVPTMRRPTGLDDDIEQRENNLKDFDSRSHTRVQFKYVLCLSPDMAIPAAGDLNGQTWSGMKNSDDPPGHF